MDDYYCSYRNSFDYLRFAVLVGTFVMLVYAGISALFPQQKKDFDESLAKDYSCTFLRGESENPFSVFHSRKACLVLVPILLIVLCIEIKVLFASEIATELLSLDCHY